MELNWIQIQQVFIEPQMCFALLFHTFMYSQRGEYLVLLYYCTEEDTDGQGGLQLINRTEI